MRVNLKKRPSLSPLSSPTSISPTSINLRSTTTRFSRSSALVISINCSNPPESCRVRKAVQKI